MDINRIIKDIPKILEYLPKLEKFENSRYIENDFERKKVIFDILRDLDNFNFIVYNNPKIQKIKLEPLNLKIIDSKINNLDLEQLLLHLTLLIKEGKYNDKYFNYLLNSNFILQYLRRLKEIFEHK